MFIHAIHNMGLVTLTHTPSPMGFLRDILERPDHEHAMLVPFQSAILLKMRKYLIYNGEPLEEIAVFFED